MTFVRSELFEPDSPAKSTASRAPIFAPPSRGNTGSGRTWIDLAVRVLVAAARDRRLPDPVLPEDPVHLAHDLNLDPGQDRARRRRARDARGAPRSSEVPNPRRWNPPCASDGRAQGRRATLARAPPPRSLLEDLLGPPPRRPGDPGPPEGLPPPHPGQESRPTRTVGRPRPGDGTRPPRSGDQPQPKRPGTHPRWRVSPVLSRTCDRRSD